jgi:hypothetical protein
MTVLVARQWPEYSSFSQTISELSAIDAPTDPRGRDPRRLHRARDAVRVGRDAVGRTESPLRVAGVLILAYGALGVLWPLAPMHQRHVLAAGAGTVSDTLHLVLAGLTVTLMLVAIGLGAAGLARASGHSIVSLIVLAACGALTFLDSPGLRATSPRPG